MSLKIIKSIKEDIVIEARSLQNAKGRLLANKFLVKGESQVLWAIENHCEIDAVFVAQDHHPIVTTLQEQKIPVFLCSEGIMKKISDTSYLVPFIGMVRIQKSKNPTNELVVVLDGVQDFGNIGTIVRTAEAFGIKEFISTKEDFDWFYTKAIDASRGKILSSDLIQYSSDSETIRELKAKGYQIAVTTLRDSELQSLAQIEGRPLAIVFGNETTGCSSELEKAADIRIQIPMSGSVESLNVGVAAGISLYELKTKWILSMLTKKIQESIGRDLFCTAHWIRKIFDLKLQAVTSFTAEQAIMMMILQCDITSSPDQLRKDAGFPKDHEIDTSLQTLIDQKLIINTHGKLSLSSEGKEAIAKIWSVHELAEHLAFIDIPDEEKTLFLKTLKKIQTNCEKVTPYEA